MQSLSFGYCGTKVANFEQGGVKLLSYQIQLIEFDAIFSTVHYCFKYYLLPITYTKLASCLKQSLKFEFFFLVCSVFITHTYSVF
jgi:hypothetical protein